VNAQPVFILNQADYIRSRDRGMRRAELGDETLEICAVCMCEVDVDPQPHRPGCQGIGAARASSAPVLANVGRESSAAARPPVLLGSARNGLDALERMDAGLPQEPELDDVDVAVLEEREPEASVDSASALPIEPVAPSRSSSTARRWTREQVLVAIRAWGADHDGTPPTRRDWHLKGDGHPNDYTVRNTLGSTWAEAIEQAGFEKPTRGTRRKVTAEEGQSQNRMSAGAEARQSVRDGLPEPTLDLKAVRAAALHAVNAMFDLLEQVERTVA
jgi:hypothetical protein